MVKWDSLDFISVRGSAHTCSEEFLLGRFYYTTFELIRRCNEFVGQFFFRLQCIEFLGPNCFTPDQYSKLVTLLKDALDMCFSRASERQAQRQDEDYDEQVEEELEEEVGLFQSEFKG